MADLPKLHVEPAPPFTYCGFDFFGSWHVQYGRSVVKRNGALFTCMASRAVHIEVADSLQPILSSTEKIHLSKERGPVQEIHCNRGTNFTSAETELNRAIEEIDDKKIKADLLKANIA